MKALTNTPQKKAFEWFVAPNESAYIANLNSHATLGQPVFFILSPIQPSVFLHKKQPNQPLLNP
jgi:hypothetical protein